MSGFIVLYCTYAPSEYTGQPGDQSSPCVQLVAWYRNFLHKNSKTCSDWVNVKAGLSLRLAHVKSQWVVYERVREMKIKTIMNCVMNKAFVYALPE